MSRFYFGSAYYPEQWEQATRADDARRMKDAGWNCVRMGEFAWDGIEPREGEFDFTLFDHAIAELGRHDIVTPRYARTNAACAAREAFEDRIEA